MYGVPGSSLEKLKMGHVADAPSCFLYYKHQSRAAAPVG
jgi:hypothetical protein